MTTLRHILSNMLKADHRQVHKLRGGLTLISYPPENNQQRVLALRQGIDPSAKEVQIIRRELLSITEQQPLAAVSEPIQQQKLAGWHAILLTIQRPPVSAEESPPPS
jgi:hypothetical protein